MFPLAIVRMRDRKVDLDGLVFAASGHFVPFQEFRTEAIAEFLQRAISLFSWNAPGFKSPKLFSAQY